MTVLQIIQELETHLDLLREKLQALRVDKCSLPEEVALQAKAHERQMVLYETAINALKKI